MGIYLGLIVYLLFLPLVVRRVEQRKEKQEKTILFWGVAAIFLLLALKRNTVGIDIAGYEAWYVDSKFRAWSDLNYIYFENGYILWMKLFSKLGASFQLFMAVNYAIFCGALYAFIRKYSKDATMSLLIFVCYQFFVFVISGVRQMIAMAFCLIAYMIFDRRKKLSTVWAIAIVLLAIQIHQSAVIFFLVLALARLRGKKILLPVYIAAILMSTEVRPMVWNFVDRYVRKIDAYESISLGGNFIFLIGIALFMAFTVWQSNISKTGTAEGQAVIFDIFSTRLIWAVLGLQIIFSGHSMLRATSYLSMFLIPALPNMLQRYDRKSRGMLKMALGCFLIWLFVTDTLIPNQLQLCPYQFFWN